MFQSIVAGRAWIMGGSETGSVVVWGLFEDVHQGGIIQMSRHLTSDVSSDRWIRRVVGCVECFCERDVRAEAFEIG